MEASASQIVQQFACAGGAAPKAKKTAQRTERLVGSNRKI
jgi:hypothetical protein